MDLVLLVLFHFNSSGAGVRVREVRYVDERCDASVWEKPKEVVEVERFNRWPVVTNTISKVSRTISPREQWSRLLLTHNE